LAVSLRKGKEEKRHMRFVPRSEVQIASLQLLPKGTYAFEIVEAVDKESRAGHPMIELHLQITNAGVTRVVRDYLVEKWPVKLRNAAEAFGLLEQYGAGAMSGADFVGKTGNANIVIERDRTKKFPDKNAVASYIVKAARPESYLSRMKAERTTP
jgi:hypothetical protein